MFKGKLNLETELITAATWHSIAISFISVWGDETWAACSWSHYPPMYTLCSPLLLMGPHPCHQGHTFGVDLDWREAAVSGGRDVEVN